MSISLLGIGIAQYRWISHSLIIAEQQFDMEVNDALKSITEKLEKQEAKIFFTQRIEYRNEAEDIVQIFDTSFIHKDSIQSIIGAHWETADKDIHAKVIVIDNSHSDTLVTKFSEEIVIKIDDDGFTHEIMERYKVKLGQLSEVMQHMAKEYVTEKIPLQKRMALVPLDSLINAELDANGIAQDYVYAVMSRDSVIQGLSSDRFITEDRPHYYQMSLFPSDLNGSDDVLLLGFPNKRAFILYMHTTMLLGSGLFSLIILLTFAITIYYMIKQKRLSDIKTDFINNMTHELKTPISTISLAVDALEHPSGKQKDSSYYSSIIKEENARMDSQLENILQMALMEKQEFKVNYEALDLNDLVTTAAKQIELPVQSRKGQLELQLEARLPKCIGDEIHLGNALRNLLDNAVKYSTEAPKIVIKTADGEIGVTISIMDQGIGMRPETQKKIFEKFFRASGGDLHDTKGFGLGLSYVKAIVEAHNGELVVHSELGRGTTISMMIPHNIKKNA